MLSGDQSQWCHGNWCQSGNRFVIRQVHRVSDGQAEVPQTIDSHLSGSWFPAASSHSKEEVEEEDCMEERIAVRCSNQRGQLSCAQLEVLRRL